ncbi:hypothetical protein J7643_06860 [bacterium]|nr:hypothetical protein [bacterium]
MKIGNDKNAASRKAAEAAARRAAEEAARKAAEEAARKAAEEAARKAAEEAARKAAAEAAKKKAEEQAKEKMAEKREARLAAYAPPEPKAKPEPKPEPKAEKKPEEKPEAKTEVKAADAKTKVGDAKADALAAKDPDPKAEARAEKKAAEEAEKKEAAKKEAEEEQGFFGKLLGSVQDAGSAVVSGAKAVGKAVKDGVDYVDEKIEDGKDYVVNKLIDPALDNSVLGKDDQYKGEKTGAVGKLVTNRLEPGESVFMKLEGDAQIGGYQVGAGAQAEIKRVQKTDSEGKAVNEPKDEKGRPPTELEVSLTVDANVGVGIQAELFAMQKGKAEGAYMGGVDMNAGAEAQAGVSGQVELKFRFDPNDTKDMEAFTGIMKSASKSTLEASIPGIGMALAASNAPDLSRDISAFASRLTEIRGEGGVYANASIDAGVSLGVHNNADAPEGVEGPAGVKGMVVDEAIAASQINVASLSAAIGGEVKVGANKDFRSDTTTLYLTVNGQAQASGNIGDFATGVGGADSRTMAVTLDKNGDIVGASIQKTMTKEQFSGLGTEDLQGRRISSKALARLEEEDSVTITYQMKPEALEAFKKQMKDQPVSAVADMIGQGYRLDMNKLNVASVTGSHVTTGELGFDVKGNQIKGTIGHGQEVALDPGAYGGKNLNSAMAEHTIIQRQPAATSSGTGH